MRASGGNNAKRHLIVPGYNTNIDHTLKGFKLPDDPTPKRLVVSVHYYDPYLFALQAKTNTWGNASPSHDNWGQEDFVVTQFDKLKSTYVDKGVPVFIGEYGATHQDGFEDYQRYYVEYVTKAAVDRGIVPVYWDNGGSGSGGEKFGLDGPKRERACCTRICSRRCGEPPRARTSSATSRNPSRPSDARWASTRRPT